MRVLIDTSYAERGPSGTGVYVRELVRALRERGHVEVVEAVQPRRMRRGRAGGSWNPLRTAGNALLDLDWLRRGLPGAAHEARADVVHHPLPAFSRRIEAPQAITVHDVAFAVMPGGFRPAWRRFAQRRHGRAARSAGAVICVSQATATDAERLLGADEARVLVAPHGPGQELPSVDRSEQPTHFLYVGDAEPRKGLDALRAAHEALDDPPPLVLAGAAATPVTETELAELYSEAIALVHPSLHEGFGLTLLEAMKAGAPVIAVRNAAVEEVCGNAALLVDERDLRDAMARVTADAGMRNELSAAGRRRAAEFSWLRSAELHERAYELAVRVRSR
jgi:glycosyltransferase involved in cell wall biosynthesis